MSSAMLVSSLLNPAPAGPTLPSPQQFQSSSSLGNMSRYRSAQLPSGPATAPLPNYTTSTTATTSPATSFRSSSPSMDVRHTMARQRMGGKDLSGFTKSKPKGVVNFPPCETTAAGIDDAAQREIRRFEVFPFGQIQDYCRHIPYNSGKKDFYEKTGRESFEVFQYLFKVSGDETDYQVMWDYNVGLVRMTPFFKCCKYSKTMPAKMLNMNPGLRDITHSITGGSIMAQGYWMPFTCARAVCATFCHAIAGALIPIFGPKFPAECIPPDSPDHGRMTIDPAIVAEAAREADAFRRAYIASHQHSMPPQMGHYGHPSVQNGNAYANGHGQYRSIHQQPTSAPNLALLSPSSSLSPKSPLVSHHNTHKMNYTPYASYPPATLRDRRFHASFSRKPSLALDIQPPIYPPDHPYNRPAEPPTAPASRDGDSPLHYGFQGAGYRPPGPPSTLNGSGWTAANHPVHHHQAPQCNTFRDEHNFPPLNTYRDARPPMPPPHPNAPYQEPVDGRYAQRRKGWYAEPISTSPPHAEQHVNGVQSLASSAHGSPEYTKYPTPTSTSNLGGKRSAAEASDEEEDAAYEYEMHDEGASPGSADGSPGRRAKKMRTVSGDDGDSHEGGGEVHELSGRSGVDKNAALLLMNLSVRDTRAGAGEKDGDDGRPRGLTCNGVSEPVEEAQRGKRRRATSM